MAIPRWLTASVGKAAQVAGRTYDYATPGAGTSTLTNAGRSIVDPKQVYSGSLVNPFYDGGGFTAPTQTGNNTGMGRGTGVAEGGGVYNPYDGAALGMSTTAGAGGAGGAYQNGIADKLRSIMSAYDQLSQGADTTANDAVAMYGKQYDQQSQDLNNDFAKAGNQLAGQYGARGLADSSYYGNAQDEAKNTYNSNVQSLIDQRNSNLATIGQKTAGAKAGYASGRQQYADILGNLGNYGAADLNSLGAQLPGQLSDLQNAQAGQGTQADFIRSIQGLPALQQQGGAQLQAQLDKLVKTGAPGFAKNQIAQGLINQAQLQDPNQANQWSQYWQQLMGA